MLLLIQIQPFLLFFSFLEDYIIYYLYKKFSYFVNLNINPLFISFITVDFLKPF